MAYNCCMGVRSSTQSPFANGVAGAVMRGSQSTISERVDDLERLRESLPGPPPPVAKPVMVVVSGLPGSGKSYLSRRLAAQVPLLVLESDALRETLVRRPSYSKAESGRLFRACHALIGDLLRQGICVLLDATNLLECHRERLYHIAEGMGARPIIVDVQAPPEVIYQRLKDRSEGVDIQDRSSADWPVYQRMSSTAEPIRRNHFVVDTSEDIAPAIAKLVREIGRRTRAAEL